MKNKFLYISLILLFSLQIMGQACFPEGLTLNSQEEIDQFPTNYPNCSQIEGMLYINGSDIANLDSLYPITSIDSSLHIFLCPSLVDIKGLSDIQDVQEIIIENNDNLLEIDGFNHISSLNHLTIVNNSKLLKIHGFSALTNIYGDLKIRNCTSLIDFDGFDQLQTIEGEFEFIFISNLSYCPQFQSLYSVGCHFYFLHNDKISDLSGFSSLISMGGNVSINNNDNLNSIHGLQHISRIAKDLEIKYNPALNDLEGLNKLNQIGGDFNVWNNNSFQSFEGLSRLDSIEGKLFIRANDHLNTLDSLINLKYLTGLIIYGNNGLTTLMGLNNITSIHGGLLYIQDNFLLNSLHGINNIDYQSIGNLRIINNENLFYCQVESICDWVFDYTGVSYIMSNAYGCNDVPEIRRACNDIGSDIHSFPVLVDHPKWNVLECDQKSPLHCKTQSYEYIGFKEMCWLNYSMLRIGEDTIYVRAEGNKTYFRTTDVCWHEEYLLYDFTLQIGDTAVVGWNQYSTSASATEKKKKVIVKNIEEVNFQGRIRTVLEISYSDDTSSNEELMQWVEGIGSLTHPFYPFVDLNVESDHYYEILCLDSLWTQIYQNPEWNSCDTLIDAIDPIDDQSDLIVSPNPFQSQITIQSDKYKIKQVNVYSITGQLIYTQIVDDPHSHVITFKPGLNKGIYLLRLHTDHGIRFRKMIKQ